MSNDPSNYYKLIKTIDLLETAVKSYKVSSEINNLNVLDYTSKYAELFTMVPAAVLPIPTDEGVDFFARRGIDFLLDDKYGTFERIYKATDFINPYLGSKSKTY